MAEVTKAGMELIRKYGELERCVQKYSDEISGNISKRHFDGEHRRRERTMKKMKTEDAVRTDFVCHDITQIIPGVTKDAVFREKDM